jgi:hypothetical protein
MWGRLSTCGGLAIRPAPVNNRQDAILPHKSSEAAWPGLEKEMTTMRFNSVWLCLSLMAVCGRPVMVAQESTAEKLAVPSLVKFSGDVKDRAGDPMKGVVGITFSVYKEEQGGTPLWHEIQNVQLDANGSYTVMLGTALPLPREIFAANEARWLGVEPAGQPEQPRALLLSVPYALKAADAETLGGRPASAFMLAAPEVDATKAVSAKDSPKSAEASRKSPDAATAAVGGSGTLDFIPLWTSSTNLGNSAMFQKGSGSTAKVGLGTTAPVALFNVAGDGAVSTNYSGLSQTFVSGKTNTNQRLALAYDTVNNLGLVQAFINGGAVQPLILNSAGGNVGVGTGSTAPPNRLTVSAPNQLSLLVEAPVTGVGAGLDMQTTGTGGKGWELLATGNTSAQGVGKLNIRDLSTAADIFTIAPGGVVGIGTTTPGTALQVTDKNHAGGAVIAADATNSSAAVFGDATATTGATTGVFGQNFSSTAGAAAVKGEAQASTGETFGVAGFNFSSGTFAAGVAASNSSGTGKTFGLSASSSSLNGTGAFATAAGESATAAGILGCCPVGVWGDSASSAGGAAGVVGTADDGRGMLASNNSPSGVPTFFAFNGATSSPTLPVLVTGGNGGGKFQSCTADISGNFTCTGHVTGTVAVKGSQQVALYSMQAPQNWFEDFGNGRLSSGAATVTLDNVFAQTVNLGVVYHVFLTPEGDCRGLYVDHKTTSGFEVHELGGGQSSVPFSYRIVALRRGYENVRLEDMTERMRKIEASRPPQATPGTRVTLPAQSPRSVTGVEIANAK